LPIFLLAVLLIPAATSLATSQGPAKTPLQIKEWTVPWEKTRPRDPYLDERGRVWFVGQEGNYIAYLDPQAGTFKRYEIEAGTNPHNLIVDKSGTVWFAGNRNARIGALDATSGKSTIYPMPGGSPRDPHTLVFDKKGDIWFTAQRGNAVGHLATKSGKVRVAKVQTENALPYGIVVDRQGRPWFVEFGSNKLGTIDPTTLAVKEYSLPNERTRARRLEITSDGAIWYGDYTRGMLARFDPKSGVVNEWPMPSGARSLPYAMAVDERDRLWIVETGIQPNRLVGFDTKAKAWISDTPIAESGAGTVRHMIYHAPTRTLWFGTDANTIGRASVP
ncbi:MAG TPA: lyase, partial [Gemmatimonadota bacterium]|nr:lyase [Gemmatimonadota bacterium]